MVKAAAGAARNIPTSPKRACISYKQGEGNCHCMQIELVPNDPGQ